MYVCSHVYLYTYVVCVYIYIAWKFTIKYSKLLYRNPSKHLMILLFLHYIISFLMHSLTPSSCSTTTTLATHTPTIPHPHTHTHTPCAYFTSSQYHLTNCLTYYSLAITPTLTLPGTSLSFPLILSISDVSNVYL